MGRIQEDLAYFDGVGAVPEFVDDTEFVFLGFNPLKTFNLLDDGGILEVFPPDPDPIGAFFAGVDAGLSLQQFITSGYFINPDAGIVHLV